MAIEFEVLALSDEAAFSIEYFLSWSMECIFVEPIPTGEGILPGFPISELLEVCDPLFAILLQVDHISSLEDSILSCESDEPASLVSSQFSEYLLHGSARSLVPGMLSVAALTSYREVLGVDSSIPML